MFCDTQRTIQLLYAGEKYIYKSSSTNNQSWGECVTNLSMMSEFAITLATPKYSVGKGYCGTIYLRIKKHCDRQQTSKQPPRWSYSKRTTDPARPPAIKANPMNKTNLAFHATPLPLYE